MTLPPPGVAAEREKKEDRLQLARETGLLVPISPPRTPACPLPSTEDWTRGLGISQKSQAAFQGLGARGGEVSPPGLGPAPASSTAPSCALSITPDFDPELQSRLAGRGLRTGHPRIRSLPSGDRTLHPQQLPHFSRSLAHQVSGVVFLGGERGRERNSRTHVLPVSTETAPL